MKAAPIILLALFFIFVALLITGVELNSILLSGFAFVGCVVTIFGIMQESDGDADVL